MYRTEDRLSGRKVALVYDAPSFPVPSGAGWLERSRLVTEFLRTAGGSTALVTRDGDGETWRAGEGAGVSFAAALEAWLEAAPEGLEESCLVVVPLDERIYVAEVEDGLVESELVAVPSLALETVRQGLAERRRVYAFEGGAQTAAVREFTTPEPLDGFDPLAYRYRAAAVAVLRRGLFHRAYLAVPVLLALGAATPPLLEFWTAGREVVQVIEPGDPLEGMHPRSARAQLGAVAAWLSPRVAGPLYAGGWQQLDVDGGVLRLRGASAGYPAAPEALAARRGGHFVLAPGGWEITLPFEGVEAQWESVAAFGHAELVRTVYRVAESVGADVSLVATMDGLTTRQSQLEVALAQPGAAHLEALGRALDGLPATVTAATCAVADWMAGSCSVGLLVKGAKG